ncbi:deoxyribonuclease IV [Patescibacteria group bacterium]|nr:deoxyribonuclease IV [Patescibacteria group bacterium]
MSPRKVGGHVSIAGGLTNSVKNTLDMSGNCLQIFAGSPRSWARNPFPQDQVQNFNKQIKQQNLTPVFIHALYLVNLASDNPNLLNKSYQALLIDLSNGQKINSAGVIVHIGSHQGRGFDSTKDQVVKLIKKLLKNTQDTPFIIENSAGEKNKIGSIEEINTLVNQINSPRVKICLDSAHLFEAGYDLRKLKVVQDLVNDLQTKKLLKHLVCLHLNDSKTPLSSGHDQHENIGQGEIGKVGLSNFINHPKLNHLPIILETPGQNKSGPDLKNIQATHALLK